MGGSGKGKHKKRSEKSKRGKSGDVNKQSKTSSSNLDESQRQINNTRVSQESKYTEDQLEKSLLENIQLIYKQAFQQLLSLGYKKEVAEKAIVMNGHGFGPANVLSNIVTNSIAFINSGCTTYTKEGRHLSLDLNERVRYLIETMVKLLQQARPDWKKADAMRHLLASNLHAVPASSIYLSLVHSDNQNKSGNSVDGASGGNSASSQDQDCYHDGSSSKNKNVASEGNFDAALYKHGAYLNRINFTSTWESQLKKNVPIIAAAYRSEMDRSPTNSLDLPDSLENNESSEESDLDEYDLLRLVEEWIESKPNDIKTETILVVIEKIRELKAQVKERKKWAEKKMIQAAQKLANDLIELKLLRMWKVEKERILKMIGKHVFEDKTAKTLLEMEFSVKKANYRVELSTKVVRRLEIRNSELRADIEACKLTTAETDRQLQEVAKREKKHLKRALAFEKQRRQLEEKIEEGKKAALQLSQEFDQCNKAIEESEENLRELLKEEELTISLILEEKRVRKTMEVNLKRTQESLCQKLEMDGQLLNDDKHRLKDELSNLRISRHSSHLLFEEKSDIYESSSQTFELMPPEWCILQDSSEDELCCNRRCVICLNNKASILFLPCTHEVLCANCNEKNTVGVRCLCCQAQIEQRITVYGANS